MTALHETLQQVRQKILRYRDAMEINEQDTKATLIQPILRALGWNVEDLEDSPENTSSGSKIGRLITPAFWCGLAS